MKRKEVCVIGLGFVGAASSVAISNAKDNKDNLLFNVTGVDQNNQNGIKKVNLINTGKFPFETNDLKLKGSLKTSIEQGNLFAVSDKKINYSKYDFICIDINVDISNVEENISFINFENIKKLINSIGKQIKQGTLVLVESTIPPGTCEEIIWPILLKQIKKRNFTSNDIFLAHSFERVMPGKNYLDSIHNYWRVYSGINKISKTKCKKFLELFINTKDYPLTELNNIRDSETAKVIENSYRAVNIAFIEEWAQFCFHNKIDLINVLDAIRLRPSHRNIMKPGIGVGGYCLTKDPLMGEISQSQIYKQKASDFTFSKSAILINRAMPISTISKYRKFIKNKKNKDCLIMGYTYKEDVADLRNSASAVLADELYNYFKKIFIYDPMLNGFFLEKYNFIYSLKELSRNIDSVFLTVGHKEFKTKKMTNILLNLKAKIFDFNCVLDKEQISLLKRNGISLYVKGRNL